MASGIRRRAEHEVMRSITEGEEVRRMTVKGASGILVAMRLRDTPVPIPNTLVKPQTADGTMLETIWESRWLPDPFKEGSQRYLGIRI